MKLFEPGKIGKLKVKNRIVMAAMGCGALIQLDGRLSQRGIDYFVARAKGGAGLITTSSCRVSREFEKASIDPFVSHLIVDSKLYADWIEELAEGVHDYGAKLSVQLMAGLGRVMSREEIVKIRPIAPSSIPCFSDPRVMTRELTEEEIGGILKAFEHSAEVLKTTGIDAIELNCHGGYLADQFQTALWNKRTDRYGGDLDGRLRFLLGIIERLKKVLGSDFPVIVKFGLTHYLEGGRGVEEGIEISRRLEAAGVDALAIDGGCYETYYWAVPSEFQPPGCMVNLAEMVKKAVKIPVIAVGKLGYPQLAEAVLQEEKADFISLGRALLADAEWPNKMREGRLEDVRPCIGCFEGCRRRTHEGKAISCAVNPSTGKEKELTISRAEKKKSVLVIGGGPAGMEAARIAALRGHHVSLWEKSDSLGGNLKPGSVPVFKDDYRRLMDYLSVQLKNLGVNITLGKKATGEVIEKLKPEVVLIATGSTPIIPDIPGVERSKVITAVDLLSHKKEAGETVVVIGGGIVGCETALYLAQEGKRVTIVELLSSIARDMYTINRTHLLNLLGDGDVKILSETRVLEITERGVIISDSHHQRSTLTADTIVLALGLKSKNELSETSRNKVPEVYSMGDCLEPRKVINAIWEGFRIARLI